MRDSLHSISFSAMGGRNELQIYSDDKALAETSGRQVVEEVNRIEAKYSRYRKESVVSQINALAGLSVLAVDQETAALFDYASACFKQSEGLFDITSGVLRRVWNFKSNELPEKKDIRRLLPLVGWNKISWQKPHFGLPKLGMEIDLGGIAKEYAVDRAAGILLNNGLRHCLINFAGDLRVCGPRLDGSTWFVGVADPRLPNEALVCVSMSSGAMATSGDYERRIEIDSKRYSHILNPKTGWPVCGLQSVTVFAESCLIAGSMSTSAMLLGLLGEKYLKSLGVDYILVNSESQVHCSPALMKQMDRLE